VPLFGVLAGAFLGRIQKRSNETKNEISVSEKDYHVCSDPKIGVLDLTQAELKKMINGKKLELWIAMYLGSFCTLNKVPSMSLVFKLD
jgi:hypothetical protein